MEEHPPGGSSNPKSGSSLFIPTARSCALASRYAWFPGHITAFHTIHGLGMSIRASGAATPLAGVAECLASASQWLISALERRHGFGSLSHRAGVAIANRVTMYHTASRSLVAEWHIVTCRCLKFCGSGQWQRLGTAIAKMHMNASQLLRKDGSISAVALGVCHASLTHRGWHFSSTVVGDPQLRQSYITPHCIKCRFSHSQAHFVSPHRFAPFGFTQQALCKIAFAGAVTSRLHSSVASRPTCSRLSPLVGC